MNFYLRWLEEMAKLRGLGKGLDALLSAANVSAAATPTAGKVKVSTHAASAEAINELALQDILLEKISPGKYQPRRIFAEAELQELADSIRHNGVIQPIVVRKIGSNYELIAGERRWRATKLAGLTHIPALIREFSDGDALAISLIENIQRKDLNVIEESRGYHRLIDEFSLTHEELAKITGKSRSHVTNLLRLLNLHVEVQEMLLLGQLNMGHARALLPLPTHLQISLAHEVADADLTTSEVERRVAKLLYKQQLDAPTKAESTAVDPDITRLETKIADKLGMVVNIKHGRKGNGKITLSYNSLDELDNLIRLF